MCKYYLVTSVTVVGSFFNVLFLLLAVMLSKLYEEPRRKDWVTKKSTYKTLCEGYTLFWLHAFPSMFFYCFLPLLPPASLVTHFRNGPYEDIYCYGWYSVWCDDIMNERSKIWKSLQFNTTCFFYKGHFF